MPERTRALIGLLLAAAACAVAAGCSGGDHVALAPNHDPVRLAAFYGDAAATCDMAHARIAIAFGGGWTTVPPGQPDPAYEREQDRRARAALAACRRDVEPGSTVTTELVSRTATRAVVLVRTTGPSGRSRAVRMEFGRFGRPVERDWSRIR